MFPAQYLSIYRFRFGSKLPVGTPEKNIILNLKKKIFVTYNE